MGINDAAEQLVAAKAECVRLERENACLIEIVTRIDEAVSANEDGGQYRWQNSDVLRLLAHLREPYAVTWSRRESEANEPDRAITDEQWELTKVLHERYNENRFSKYDGRPTHDGRIDFQDLARAALTWFAALSSGVAATDTEPSDEELIELAQAAAVVAGDRWATWAFRREGAEPEMALPIQATIQGFRALYSAGRSVALGEAKAQALEEAADEIRDQLGRDEVALCGFDGEWQLARSSRNMLNGATRFGERLRARAAAIREGSKR